MGQTRSRAKPQLSPEYCKGCERCIASCAQGCIEPGASIHPLSGLVPVVLHLEACNACGLCIDACPEPYGMVEQGAEGGLDTPPAPPQAIANVRIPLRDGRPLVAKGAHAAAIGALLAGCRHFFGYPITPSTEGAELMAKLLPQLGGSFLQAPSETATVNFMYGCGGAGLPSMTFTSSPGFSLMLEGISYMIASEIPGVFVNVMRAGPGLGNIGPAQADLKLACRGLGHGDTHAVVLAPATPQEMLDFTFLSFEIAFRWRSPVVVMADGYLGQMTGSVRLPNHTLRPGLPSWAVYGDAAHRGNLHTSIHLRELDLEACVRALAAKMQRMSDAEQRSELYRCEEAEVLVVACNTPARMAKGAVEALRAEGIAAGLFRPQTVWPFPIRALVPLLDRARRVVVVEASEGQLEDEMRLALSHAGVRPPEIAHVRRNGGVLPSQHEIMEGVRMVAPAARRVAP